MFEIKCCTCGNVVAFKDGLNDEREIQLDGEIECIYQPDVFIECQCGNEITIKKN
ncbi:hypothetical protein FXB61_005970 [Bacillus cereus]|uniref:hypothetical protein n=1 Tax=Bacillus cereus TaxID=1396 RepID=UPI00125C9FB6|nr:hypothetical protein [Bacillus cereus]KAA1803364.1 hypothetical protein FXB61_005970 [Bacillus cereus]